MKNFLFGLAAVVLLFTSVVRAGEGHKDHPCKAIKAACEAAGFKKGDHQDKKGLYMDCVKPIMAGGTVAGVAVPASTVEACKAKKAAHKEHHEDKH